MAAFDLSVTTLERLATYCAFRAEAFSTEIADLNVIERMTGHNLRELEIDLPVTLTIERPAICDGRMQPHEWLLAEDGNMLKTDSGSHGDDHFFPGPADIAWDLAGAIIEWQMDEAQAEVFLEIYRRASGDDARGRIADFTIAYAAFRSAYSRMAANALAGDEEEIRHRRAAAAYDAVFEQLGRLTVRP